jgi:hypothetical protein
MDFPIRKYVWGAAAALMVVSLLGCVPGSPAGVPSTSNSGQPTPTATAAPERPAPRLTVGCADLVPLDVVRAGLSDDVEAMPLRSSFRAPDEMASLQLGGLRCVWANGPRAFPWEDPVAGFAEAVVNVIPAAEDVWARYAPTSPPEPSPYGNNANGPFCTGAESRQSGTVSHACEFDALVGSYWINVSLTGVAGNAAASNEEVLASARQITDPLVATLSRADEPEPQWAPPQSPPQITCDIVLTDAQAAELTGIADVGVGPFWDGPMVGQFSYALEETGANRCHLLVLGPEAGVGQVTYLPGGGWAFRELSPSWVEAGDATLIELAGAEAGEEFTEECERADRDCRVDMLVGENWIQVTAYASVPERMSPPEGVDLLYPRTQIREIAETVLANLHSAD